MVLVIHMKNNLVTFKSNLGDSKFLFLILYPRCLDHDR